MSKEAVDPPHNVWLQCRRLLRLSQASVAEVAGVSRQSIGKLEAGERQPKTAELLRLASLFRVRPEALMANENLTAGMFGDDAGVENV